MAGFNISVKELKINRNQQMSLVAVGVAVIAIVITLFFALKMQAKMVHQSNVIACLRTARVVIEDNRDKINSLQGSYDAFNESKSLYDDQQLGENAVIVLRALPTTYNKGWTQQAWDNFLRHPDKPTERRPGHEGATITVSGFPDPVGGEEGAPLPPAVGGEEGADNPAGDAIPLQFSMSINLEEGGEETLINILEDLDDFIQPVKVRKISLTYSDEGDGSESRLSQASLDLQTYIQPAAELQFPTNTVDEKAAEPECTKKKKKQDTVPKSDSKETEEAATGGEGDQQ